MRQGKKLWQGYNGCLHACVHVCVLLRMYCSQLWSSSSRVKAPVGSGTYSSRTVIMHCTRVHCNIAIPQVIAMFALLLPECTLWQTQQGSSFSAGPINYKMSMLLIVMQSTLSTFITLIHQKAMCWFDNCQCCVLMYYELSSAYSLSPISILHQQKASTHQASLTQPLHITLH